MGLIGLAGAISLLYWGRSHITGLVAGGALGTSQGIFFGAANPLWARYFGLRHLGTIRGAVVTLTVAASSVGPLLAGITRDWQGSFNLALILFAILPLPVAALSLLAAPPRTFASSN